MTLLRTYYFRRSTESSGMTSHSIVSVKELQAHFQDISAEDSTPTSLERLFLNTGIAGRRGPPGSRCGWLPSGPSVKAVAQLVTDQLPARYHRFGTRAGVSLKPPPTSEHGGRYGG